MSLLAFIPAISTLLDKLIPDPEAAANAKLKLLEMEQAGELARLTAEADIAKGQMQINAAEAANPSLFVSGWRSFIGWVCGAAFAYHFVLQPLLAFAIANSGQEVVLPSFDMETLTTVLLGILGLGGLRTIEKFKK